MIEYAFDTITAEQALTLKLGDTITFNGGPGRTVSVAYEAYDPLALTLAPARVHVTYEGRTVTFPISIVEVAKAGGLVMADGSQLYIGDAGNDRIMSASSDDALFGGPGVDTLNGGGGRDLLQGNNGDDVFAGGEGADTIHGGQGSDVIFTSREVGGVDGEAGDWAHGNVGNDDIFGGAGRDTLYGGQDNDIIDGGAGGDLLFGDRGDDELVGGLGDDTLTGGDGDDIVDGGDGGDLLLGDRGRDDLRGGLGDDTLNGGDDDDRLSAGFGSDLLNGGDGNDELFSQGEKSTLNGGAGDDIIISAGAGRDVIFGGEGKDQFEFFFSGVAPSTGVDAEIRDWEAGDKIYLAEVGILGISAIPSLSYSELTAADYASALSLANERMAAASNTHVVVAVGNDLYVFANTGDLQGGADTALLLVGRTLADIDSSNFI